MKKKADKEMENLNQISEALYSIQQVRETTENVAESYNDDIDKAAELEQDEYSNQLIAEKVEFVEFANDLKFMEMQIRRNAVTAHAMNELQTIIPAINACRRLLGNMPDLTKLGKNMASLQDTLKGARMSLKDLRAQLSDAKDSEYTELFGRKKAKDPKTAERIEAEKRDRELRLMKKNPIPTPLETSNAETAPATGVSAFEAMLEAEKRNKK